MKRTVIQVVLTDAEDTDAVALKQAIEKLLEETENVTVGFTINEITRPTFPVQVG